MVCELVAELLNCIVSPNVVGGCVELMPMIYKFLEFRLSLSLLYRKKPFVIKNKKKQKQTDKKMKTYCVWNIGKRYFATITKQ